jgi:hypothetical protein
MEELLLNLINKIGDGMPELSTVDEDYGQIETLLNDKVDQYPLTFPAVLIDSPSIIWDNIERGSQKGVCTVTVKLAIDCYDDTHYSSGIPSKNKISDRAAMVAKLHKLLQDTYPAESSTALIRTHSQFQTIPQTGVKVYMMTYTCELTDSLDEETITQKNMGIKINFQHS